MIEEGKIGVITHYYNSQNYGGNLQAYALCKVLETLTSSEVEQICYDTVRTPSSDMPKKTLAVIIRHPIKVFRNIKSRILVRYTALKDAVYKEEFETRRRAIMSFNQGQIKHSQIVYNFRNIAEASQKYDIFITGSDQVWNPRAIHPAYLLTFVENKPKFSYAASIACDTLTEAQQEMFKSKLADYLAISVREEKAKTLLEPLVEQEVHCVLDPTLLLSREDWGAVASAIDVPEKYAFCYFLGDDLTARALARQYAEKHGLTLVTLPFMSGHYRKCDKNFGDLRLFDVTPQQFIFLVQNASIVFTDSFHAGVFSNIFEKEYFVFSRGQDNSMNSRIYQLNALFGREYTFCDTPNKKKLQYLEENCGKEKSFNCEALDKERKKSLNFLADTLEKAKRYE